MATVEHCLYCFEVLSARLELRDRMSLYQVQASWDDYPKGLDDDDEEEEDDDADEPANPADLSSSSAAAKRPKMSPALERLAVPRSNGTSSTSSISSSSRPTSVSTSASTPPSSANSSSTESFHPVGIGRRTSQRANSITESPLFVTWNKVSSTTASRSLRGCIGTFESQGLAEGLASYSLTSALSDVRFNPITVKELPRLEVSVTLLTDFETCNDPMDWELGVHGLRVSFYHHHKRFGATYLPDVAVEQGWTKEETMISLMRKAGWLGKKEKWREVADLKIVRYQGKQESVDYEEFKRWKDWVDAKGKK